MLAVTPGGCHRGGGFGTRRAGGGGIRAGPRARAGIRRGSGARPSRTTGGRIRAPSIRRSRAADGDRPTRTPAQDAVARWAHPRRGPGAEHSKPGLRTCALEAVTRKRAAETGPRNRSHFARLAGASERERAAASGSQPPASGGLRTPSPTMKGLPPWGAVGRRRAVGEGARWARRSIRNGSDASSSEPRSGRAERAQGLGQDDGGSFDGARSEPRRSRAGRRRAPSGTRVGAGEPSAPPGDGWCSLGCPQGRGRGGASGAPGFP